MRSIRNIILKLIPSRFQFLFVSISNQLRGGYAEKHYSQFGEDIVLERIFRKTKKGFYIDIGAHHPKRYSNTYLLYKKGWKGIIVDPNPESIFLFRWQRKRDLALQIGIAKQEGKLTYYRFSDPAVNTFSEEKKNEWIKKDWIKLLSSDSVITRPMGDLLGEYVPDNQKIDLMSIDAEGFDLEILESNDWTRFKPDVVVVEDDNFIFEMKEKSKVYQFLITQNYKLDSKVGPSLIFVNSYVI